MSGSLQGLVASTAGGVEEKRRRVMASSSAAAVAHGVVVDSCGESANGLNGVFWFLVSMYV